MWTIDEDTVDISLDYLNSGRVIYPYNCLHLDLSQVQEMEGKKIEDLYIELSNPEDVEQYSVEVRFKEEVWFATETSKTTIFTQAVITSSLNFKKREPRSNMRLKSTRGPL